MGGCGQTDAPDSQLAVRPGGGRRSSASRARPRARRCKRGACRYRVPRRMIRTCWTPPCIQHAPAGVEARIACLVPSITELICASRSGPRNWWRAPAFAFIPRSWCAAIPKVGGNCQGRRSGQAARAQRPTHVVLNIDENIKPVAEGAGRFRAARGGQRTRERPKTTSRSTGCWAACSAASARPRPLWELMLR